MGLVVLIQTVSEDGTRWFDVDTMASKEDTVSAENEMRLGEMEGFKSRTEVPLQSCCGEYCGVYAYWKQTTCLS